MSDSAVNAIDGDIIDAREEISFTQLCRRCAVDSELLERLVEEGVLEPVRRTETTLYFESGIMRQVRTVMRLRSDLGVNLAGAALALQLLDRIEKLEAQLNRIPARIRR